MFTGMNYRNVKSPVSIDRWCVHSYYTINPYAPDGSGRLLFCGADLKTRRGSVYVASKEGEIIARFGDEPVSENFFHTGLWQSWSPDSKCVYYQKGTLKRPVIAKRNIETSEEEEIDGSTEGSPPFGEPIVAGYLGMLYAAGYGDMKYKPEDAPFPFQEREKHGLFAFSFADKKSGLLLSVADVLENLVDRELIEYWDKKMREEYGAGDGLTLMCYAVRWNAKGDRCLFYFGNHTVPRVRKEPKIAYIITADRDFKDIHVALDLSFNKPGLHWSWHPDGKRLIGYGPDPEDRTKMCLSMVGYEGKNYVKVSGNSLGGHPSVCPTDYNLIVTDGKYFSPDVEGDLMGQIAFIEASTGREVEKYIFGRKNTLDRIMERNEHWVCHHPVFTSDGRKVLVNTLQGQNAQLKEIVLR